MARPDAGKSPTIHVTGEVTVPTSGYTATLRKHEPQGINDKDLLLDLIITEPTGAVNEIVTVIPVEYVEETDFGYTTASVIECALNIPVRDVSQAAIQSKLVRSLGWRAARFHAELATAYFLQEIVTTNWDTYFEEYAACTPIVIPTDYAFWDMPGRKVFKLHGSMNNLSTLVITTKDYKQCDRRLRTRQIGATLKHMLATKQVTFIGYSFGDPDLNSLLRFMRRELKDVLPRSWLLTPHGRDDDQFPPERVIVTDGAYFIRKLKDAAVDLGAMRPDSIYNRVRKLLGRAARANERAAMFSAQEFPSVIHCLSYQNGLRHALGRILALESSGHYSNPHSTHVIPGNYELLRKTAVRKKRYFDAAYIEGYQNGLISLEVTNEDLRHLPLYFVWGSKWELIEPEAFEAELKRSSKVHRAATAEAERAAKHVGEGLVAIHTPFLGGLEVPEDAS